MSPFKIDVNVQSAPVISPLPRKPSHKSFELEDLPNEKQRSIPRGESHTIIRKALIFCCINFPRNFCSQFNLSLRFISQEISRGFSSQRGNRARPPLFFTRARHIIWGKHFRPCLFKRLSYIFYHFVGNVKYFNSKLSSNRYGIDKKGMTFDHYFGYSFPLLSFHLKK